MPRQLVLPEAPAGYARDLEQRFRRQVELELADVNQRLDTALFGTFPWVPEMRATVDTAGPFKGESVVEAGYQIGAYRFTFTTSDASLYPLDEVSSLSDGTDTDFDPGANPRQGATYTPGSPEAAPKTFYALLRTGNIERVVQANILEGYLMFWGKSANTALTEAQIEALASEVVTDFKSLRALPAGASVYAWLCWPSVWGAATAFTNAATGAAIAFNAPSEVTVTNAYSAAATYYAYRSTATLDAAVSIAIT